MTQQINESQVANLVSDLAARGTIVGIQEESYTYAADTGSANTYVVALSPAPSLVAGSVVSFKAANSNTGASTLNVNGAGATTIKKNGNATALAAGDITAGQIIDATFDGTVWQILVPGGGSSSPLTTKGDLFGFDTAGNRIAVGADGKVLTADSTNSLGVSWQTNPAGFTNPMTTAGDIIAGGSAGAAARLAVGTSGQVLKVVSGAPAWSSPVGVIGVVIDGGGAVPATGAKGVIQAPYDCVIAGWTMLADQSGSAQITVSKGAYSAFPTVSSIDASAPPNLSSAQKNTSTTLTGWTTSISAGDVLSFNLDSVTSCQRIILELQVTKS